jgi:hypothetical protein
MPAEDAPLAKVRRRAGCHKREIAALPTTLPISPMATVFFPVVVLRVITVRKSAYFRRGPKRLSPDGW